MQSWSLTDLSWLWMLLGQSCHRYINTSIFMLWLTNTLDFESTSHVDIYLLHCPNYMQSFHHHHMPFSPQPSEERIPQYQYLAALAYHFHLELPSCQSKDARWGHGRVWGFTCGRKRWSWGSGGWDCDFGSWYVISDDGRWEWAGRDPALETEYWNYGGIGHRWVFVVLNWDYLIRRNRCKGRDLKHSHRDWWRLFPGTCILFASESLEYCVDMAVQLAERIYQDNAYQRPP